MFTVDEDSYNEIRMRFKAVLEALPEREGETLVTAAQVQSYQARYYAYGWQDRGGDPAERDTSRCVAFGEAYGTVWGLHALKLIPARPKIAEAWASWSEHGHIVDDILGVLKKLDLIEPNHHQLSEAERFFYEHAPISYNPETETEESGRIRVARALAAAEERLKAGPYFVDVEPDTGPYEGDNGYDGPLWVVSLYSVEGATDATDSRLIESLWNVACETESDPYIRVVAAELADSSI